MLRTFLAIFLACSCLAACSTPGTPLPDIALEINETLYRDSTVLGPGDKLVVRLTQVPEPSDWLQEIVVGPDGKGSFLEIDELVVAGRTLTQLDSALEKAYAEVLQAPDLTVDVTEYAGRHVTVFGEVEDGGRQELDSGRRTLIEALGMADLAFSTANLETVVLLRWDPQAQARMSWIINASEEFWEASDPVLLQAYDVILVPRTDVVKLNNWVDQYMRRMIPFPQIFYSYSDSI